MLRAVEELTFEEATAEIEQITLKLKENLFAIEHNAELYVRAVLLTRHAKRLLVNAHGRVTIINEQR